jgi:hypothetical protein
MRQENKVKVGIVGEILRQVLSPWQQQPGRILFQENAEVVMPDY